MTRLARYRQLLARIEPTDPNDFAGQPEIYVPPPSALPRKLATALALQPASSHLLVGPIGSGKTTTVRRTQEELGEQLAGTTDSVEYIDVSTWHRLDAESLTGVLVALAGVLLRLRHQEPQQTEPIRSAVRALWRHAHGYTDWVEESPERADALAAWLELGEAGDPKFVPGALQMPGPSARLLDLVPHLEALRAASGSDHWVFLFDSLDRLDDSTRFKEAVEEDLPVLRAAGIGVVVVGPARFAFSKDRSVANLFDEIHVVQTANAESPEGVAFLSRVLRSRADPAMLPDEVVTAIARASGGVLRDLLSIATRAARDAYDRGHDQVTLADVHDAILAVGAAKSVGLDASSLELLRQVAAGQPFTLDEKRLYLVERSQVVQTEVGTWKVHPALRAFLDSQSKAA